MALPLLSDGPFPGVFIEYLHPETSDPIFDRPWLAPLLFPNQSSDARDHCANERTFLSWLRLSIYLAIVSAAVILSFHLKADPTVYERHLALPLGLVFWLLSVVCLGNGLGNYVTTVRQYARQRALVQSGWKTQSVFATVGGVIVSSSLLLLITGALGKP